MRIRSLTYEDALYLLAFGLALGFRLFSLGAAPLNDTEASWALQALDLSRGGQPQLGAQAAYVLLTGLSFTIFNATNFLARLLPALAGSLLVLLPNILRPLLGDTTRLRWSGLVLAFGLALDPGLVAQSRTAGSLMPALAFSLLALALYTRRKMTWTGIAAGLALLSGPALLHGILILVLCWGIYRLVVKQAQRTNQQDAPANDPAWEIPPLERSELHSGLFALIGTLLVAGVLFLRAPQGLGALAATLPAYLQGWVSPGGIPALRLPVALLVYQPLVVVLALLAAGQALRSPQTGTQIKRLVAGLSLWALVGLSVTMLYPARQVGDVSWVLVPLWGLAALELPHYLLGNERRSVYLVAGGLAALLSILAGVVWVNLLNISSYKTTLLLFWLMSGGVTILGLISTIMVAAGWSTVSARLGLVWSLCLVLGLSMLSGVWGVAFLHPQEARELWSASPATGQVDQLVETLIELSQTTTGHDTEIEIVLLEDSASLRWALRQFSYLTVADGLAASDAPAIVITDKTQQTPALAQRYRGQDLVWRIYPAWQSVLPSNLGAWLAFRQAPLATEQIILWARADLFPDGLETLPNGNQPEMP